MTAGQYTHNAPMVRALPAVLALLPLLLCVQACEDDNGGTSGSGQVGPGDVAVQPYTYAETTAGLKQMFEDMAAAASGGNRAKAEVLARSLELPDPVVWFGAVFGEDPGKELSDEYETLRGNFAQIVDLLLELREGGQTVFSVERFDRAGDKAASMYQSRALSRMVKSTPLYSVRVASEDGGKVFHLWSFVYHDGRFRWIGKAKALVGGSKASVEDGQPDVKEYRVRDAEKVDATAP